MQVYKPAENFLLNSRKGFVKKSKRTWNVIFFEKKRFFPGQVECSFDYPSWKVFSRKGKNPFAQGPIMKHFFWDKNVNISSGQLECIFDNPPQSFRPLLCEFYKPVKRFSTTAEKIQPNVGRWMENYNLLRSNNDPRNVTLDMFTAIWTIPLENFSKQSHLGT